MPEKAGYFKFYDKHFFLDEAKLRRIGALLEEFAAKLGPDFHVSYRVFRGNDRFFETRNIDEVLGDDNPPIKGIEEISLRILASVPKRENASDAAEDNEPAVIGFSKKKDPPIVVVLSGERREWCFLLGDELDAQIARIMRGRSRIVSFLRARVTLPVLLLIAGAIFSIVVGDQSELRHPQLSAQEIANLSMEERTRQILLRMTSSSDLAKWMIPGAAAFLIMFFVIMEYEPLNRLLRRVEKSVFYWGDAASDHDLYQSKLNKVKWGVLIAFVVSLVSSILAAVLLR